MISPDPATLERRVLVVAPTRRDATLTEELLSAGGIAVEICESPEVLIQEVERGAAAILVPEEGITPAFAASLTAVLGRQPAWSDLPVLILARSGADSAASREAVRTLGNVTLLERPVQTATLLSAVRTALRARARQLQIRGHLAEREQAEESLRLADRRKDEFLATLGHELRNPLAPIVTGLHLLKTSGVDHPRVRNVTAVMERQVHHLVRLVDDLLEVSRITRGLLEIRREPIDLVFALRSAIETSRPVLDTARHELSVDLPSEPVTVAGDADRLTQVFANLLTNAAKYTNAGGRIWLTVTREGPHVRISVRDNGIGIPVAHLDSVFDMFMQVDRSNRRAQGGLGIGLTLVRSLVALHGGRVEARSDGPGTGSEFIVEFPLIPQPAESAHDSNVLLPFPPRRILVVDDNRDAADTLAELLKSLGATVAVAHSGDEALDRQMTFGPDAVLLDIGMPGKDGYAVARCMRATPSRADVLLIALTGWGQDHDIELARSAGFDNHLVKPPDIEKLRGLLTAGWSAESR